MQSVERQGKGSAEDFPNRVRYMIGPGERPEGGPMTAESVVRRGAGRPPRISRAEIFEAVLGLGEAGGLDAVSVRGVGALGAVQASSLYNPVSTKEELLDGAADQVVAG